MLTKCHIILYVRDQDASMAFYSAVLQQEPDLHVPGMTEFALFENTVLGLMPEASIVRVLGERLPDPAAGRGVPRAEVYLLVEDPPGYHRRALAAGARNISDLGIRDWGHEAAYCLDPDGHVVAFARQL